jgi:hypothetical protein
MRGMLPTPTATDFKGSKTSQHSINNNEARKSMLRNVYQHTEIRFHSKNFPTESPICGGDDGIPTELDGITFSKWRAESIKGYGNAIVPQVALELFKVIEKINCNLSK